MMIINLMMIMMINLMMMATMTMKTIVMMNLMMMATMTTKTIVMINLMNMETMMMMKTKRVIHLAYPDNGHFKGSTIKEVFYLSTVLSFPL